MAKKRKKQKRKRKLTAAEKTAKRQRRLEYEFVFVNGKQKRVRRPPTIDGMPVEEFMRRNADLICLHEDGMWDVIEAREAEAEGVGVAPSGRDRPGS